MNLREAIKYCLDGFDIRRKIWEQHEFLYFSCGAICDDSRGSSGISAGDSEAKDWEIHPNSKYRPNVINKKMGLKNE